MMPDSYDHLVLGAGIFGLYGAWLAARRGERVAIVDVDPRPFSRASSINQARLHNGYHYPRSVSTALKTASYYDRFIVDFSSAITPKLTQIYAIPHSGSFTSAENFERFCEFVGIPAVPIDPSSIFVPQLVAAAYETQELSFDAGLLRQLLLARLEATERVSWFLGRRIAGVTLKEDSYLVRLEGDGAELSAQQVLNATYASSSQVMKQFGYEGINLRYELCEVALMRGPPRWAERGVTMMDGPFFSMMPLGRGDLHTLTAVDLTPRRVVESELPTLDCQSLNPRCSPQQLDNCDGCPARPVSAWPYMRQLAGKYLVDSQDFRYERSGYSMKAILLSSEVDDSRPTLIIRHSERPAFISVLSGKVTTIYDLEDVV